MLRADTRLGRLVKALAGPVSSNRPKNRIIAALAAIPASTPTKRAPANSLNNVPARRYDGVRRLLATLAVTVIVAITFVFNADIFHTQIPGTPHAQVPTTPRAEPDTLPMYDGAPLPPWSGYVGSDDNWNGVEFVSGAASLDQISAAPDGQGGMRVTWHGNAAQVYLQSPGVRDMTPYVDADGALVFDVILHQEPEGDVTVGAHCVYPCAAVLPFTDLVQELVPGRRTTVKIPLSCFTPKGLNPRLVNTPFLVHATGPFDATFFNIRWEPGAATDDDATSCDELR